MFKSKWNAGRCCCLRIEMKFGVFRAQVLMTDDFARAEALDIVQGIQLGNHITRKNAKLLEKNLRWNLLPSYQMSYRFSKSESKKY